MIINSIEKDRFPTLAQLLQNKISKSYQIDGDNSKNPSVFLLWDQLEVYVFSTMLLVDRLAALKRSSK